MTAFLTLISGFVEFLVRKFLPKLVGKFGWNTAINGILSVMTPIIITVSISMFLLFVKLLLELYDLIVKVFDYIQNPPITVTGDSLTILNGFYCLLNSSGIAGALTDLIPLYFTLIINFLLIFLYRVTAKTVNNLRDTVANFKD